MGYQHPAVVGIFPATALPGHTASPRRDPVVEPPTLASLLHEYSTGGQDGGDRLPPSAPASEAPSSNEVRVNTPQERRDHPWSSDEGSVNPESSDDEEPPDETGLEDVLNSQREILESALLLLQQLRERIEELEVQATDQKMSLGDTITRLRRRVRTLESGAGRSASLPSGRGGAGHAYVTYPALEGRHYVTHPDLAAFDYVPRADLPTPIPPQLYLSAWTQGSLT